MLRREKTVNNSFSGTAADAVRDLDHSINQDCDDGMIEAIGTVICKPVRQFLQSAVKLDNGQWYWISRSCEAKSRSHFSWLSRPELGSCSTGVESRFFWKVPGSVVRSRHGDSRF
jgi:hypothetical protein